MTWLTKIVIPQREALNNCLSDCYEWHKFAWTCFPLCPQAKRDFLTRLDFLPSQGAFRMYILSQRPTVCPSTIDRDWWESKEIAEGFLAHDTYRFSLRANPTRVKTEGNRKMRLALLDRVAQVEWLQRKAMQSGFTIDSNLTIRGAQDYRCCIRGKQTLRIGIDFEGFLRVLDHKKFREAFYTGIGKSKGFGFGMLLILPCFETK